MLQLEVILALIVGDDGYTIIQLKEVGVGRIIHQHYITQLPITQDPEVLHKDPLLRLPTIIPVEPMWHHLLSRIKVIDNDIRVAGMTRSEDDYLHFFR